MIRLAFYFFLTLLTTPAYAEWKDLFNFEYDGKQVSYDVVKGLVDKNQSLAYDFSNLQEVAKDCHKTG